LNDLTLIEHFPYIGLFLLLIIGGIGIPFPEDMTLILCGFFISQSIVKPFPAIIVVYAGLLTADIFLYYMGRRYGRMIVTHKRFQKMLTPERLAKLEERFHKRGVMLIFAGRHVFGLRAQLFLVAGVMRMPFLIFSLSDALSALITMAIMVGAGYAGGNSLQVIRKEVARVEHIAMLSAVVILIIYVAYRYFRVRND